MQARPGEAVPLRWSQTVRLLFAAALACLVWMLGTSPASADIESVEPEATSLIQGGLVGVSVELDHDLGLTCVVASDVPATVVVLGLPGCLLGDNLITITTTALTPTGEYTILFQEKNLLTGAVVDEAPFHLTVKPLLGTTTSSTTTSTSTTTTTSTTSTTSTTTTTTTTTTSIPSTTTTTIAAAFPSSTTTTVPLRTTTTTTAASSSTSTTSPTSSTMRGHDGSTTTTSTTVMPTATVTTIDDSTDEAATVGGADGPTLPPPLAAPTDTFLDSRFPTSLQEVVLSPFHVLAAIMQSIAGGAERLLLLAAVLGTYGWYLIRRWRRLDGEVEL